MKPLTRILICLLPCLLAGFLVARAAQQTQAGTGGFKFGVDLVGGTILTYHVNKQEGKAYSKEELTGALKKRIDPTDLKNVTIRAVGEDRVEIILPTGGAADGSRSTFTTEEVQEVKSLITQVGSLEFRIVANSRDDQAAIAETEQMYTSVSKDVLESAALSGDPPPAPPAPFDVGPPVDSKLTYAFVEIGQAERKTLELNNDAGVNPNPAGNWKRVEEARKAGKPVVLPQMGGCLVFSRECVNEKISAKLRAEKKYEYFLLLRNSEEGKAVTGKFLTNAAPGQTTRLDLSVDFSFDSEGAFRFQELTSKNRPTGEEGAKFHRYLAVVLDGQVMTAPSLNAVISDRGQISGGFKDMKDVNRLVNILKAGALPATLDPLPESENSMGATLGADTIRKGMLAVGIAFVAVLAFMLFYYRFAGLVACIALFANLLLTVAFMVGVSATFTLPGLAGLVLMLGMAVDANVLIYERIREERDRGASLALALRNGYDHAMPTIIDTHLSSIFNALILWAVGNDQLKGFGISLTIGLVISLFTSLFMTWTIFTVCLNRGWLRGLSMIRALTRTNIDFMAIRYYWFAATLALTVLGVTVFLIRGESGLNIDFVGGTAYTGRLSQPTDIGSLRSLIETNLQTRLAVTEARQLDEHGRDFKITYADGSSQEVRLTQPATEADVARRARTLADWSLVQRFVAGDDPPPPAGQSRFFDLRTTEKEQDLVQVSIDRLLSEEDKGQWVSLLAKTEMKAPEVLTPGRKARLTFTDFASPGQLKQLLAREVQFLGLPSVDSVRLRGTPGTPDHEGRYTSIDLEVTQAVDQAKFAQALAHAQKEFNARPVPEQLENFGSQLASETRLRALYAIIGSWLAILLYLWFRFGNWTFGLATVICLIHDLFFTLGVIAFCHWLHQVPFLASVLQIEDFKIGLPEIAALLTLIGYSVNDTIVVFDRIREVRGKNPDLTPQMINDSVNQTLSRTLLTALTVWLVVSVLYFFGGEGVHLFAFCMVVGVIVGTYSSIYIASPLLLIFGEGSRSTARQRRGQNVPANV